MSKFAICLQPFLGIFVVITVANDLLIYASMGFCRFYRIVSVQLCIRLNVVLAIIKGKQDNSLALRV